MVFTDLFIKRPVLATVISLLILTLGLYSIGSLPIRQYPFTQSAVVVVNTAYIGANSADIASFITTPLEKSIAQAGGIDYMTSSSAEDMSQISVNLLLNYDPLKALADISAKVNAVLNQLPKAAQTPVLSITVGQSIDSMYLGFYSDELPINKITDYLAREVQPKLQAVDGVQHAEILGNNVIALRVWMDPVKLAGYGLSAADVAQALSNNNITTALGRTDGEMFIQNLTTNTDIHDLQQFKKMVVQNKAGAIIRLEDIGRVELGRQDYNTAVSFNGREAAYIGIVVAPAANLLTVINDIKKIFPDIKQTLPTGLDASIVYDSSVFVNSSVHEVVHSLGEAFLIVTLVIFLFLGSIRSVIIPLLAIPLSLIGAFLVMNILGFSINLLTLLALVLAIGLVVDDAIIIVENIQRHIEEGKNKYDAAIIGARELFSPIIAITVVLIAVYLPIAFMKGLTGALFCEFAFSLVGAVTVSAVVALTLSPMICSKLLKDGQDNRKSRFLELSDHYFKRLERAYEAKLEGNFHILPVIAVFAGIIIFSNYFLFMSSMSELAPQEDAGIILSQVSAPANASLEQTKLYSKEVRKIFDTYPEKNSVFALDGLPSINKAMIGMNLKPWEDRKLNTNVLQQQLQGKLGHIAGAQAAAFQLPSLPGGGSGLPIEFVITGSGSISELNDLANQIIEKAKRSGEFAFMDSDLKIDKLQSSLVLDRLKAASLGFSMTDVANQLASAMSGGYINYFNYEGQPYQVIAQVDRAERENPNDLLNLYLTSPDGAKFPLKTIGHMEPKIVPESLNHFQQLNSVTISAVNFPVFSMGQVLNTLKAAADSLLPQSYHIDYAGQSRQYIKEGSSLILSFFMALIMIYLSLAALFESFRDPLIVLISVPMSIFGAMVFISLGIGQATLNIYSEVGLVTLIGLISKHGILIVEFANELQISGQSKKDAIIKAASVRLRPILMTTGAMVLGVVPLITATGAGAASRFNIGLVIAAGLSIGTLFTLFVVPAIYMLLAQDHRGEAKLS